ncbi:MAG: hypothetical protein C5B43_01310 [Verrucomicrobia bacterium]|nr:MAG: hypothetical protein C5B43_01310 [Verrucomicrobiota bacterium]
MENTSCGDNCPFVKKGFCGCERECPNYIESWWIESEKGVPKLIKDCSPKRLIIQQQYLQSRLEGMQKAAEQARNELHEFTSVMRSLVEQTKQILIRNLNSNNLLDKKNEDNLVILHDINNDDNIK